MTEIESPQASHLVEVRGEVIRMELRGELDLAVAAQVTAWFEDALNANPGKDLEVDLGLVEFLDSSGIRALLNAYTMATAKGQQFHVVGATGGVLEVLEIVAVHELLAGDGNLTRE